MLSQSQRDTIVADLSRELFNVELLTPTERLARIQIEVKEWCADSVALPAALFKSMQIISLVSKP